VTREIFDAFRAQGFLIGAYFSKPDWHSPTTGGPIFATPDRNPNYDLKRYPERWARFVEFTHAQIQELMTDYGRVDILWLDGGWVRTLTDAEIRDRMNRPDYRFLRLQSQDIDMPAWWRTPAPGSRGSSWWTGPCRAPSRTTSPPRPECRKRPSPTPGRCACPWPPPGRSCRGSLQVAPHADPHAGGRGGQGWEPPPQHRPRPRRALAPGGPTSASRRWAPGCG